MVLEEELDEQLVVRANPLQMLNVIQLSEAVYKRLMYMDVVVNGERLYALLDTGASHNFLRIDQVQRIEVQGEAT